MEWFFLGLAIVIIAIIVFCRIRRSIYVKFIIQNSNALKKLYEINQQSQFYDVEPFYFRHKYDNENFYSVISCEDYLIYQLQYKSREVLDAIDNIAKNKRLFDDYIEKINNCCKLGSYSKETTKYNM